MGSNSKEKIWKFLMISEFIIFNLMYAFNIFYYFYLDFFRTIYYNKYKCLLKFDYF